MTSKQMRLAVLGALEKVGTQHCHKMSLIGSPYSRGLIELQAGVSFDEAERALAGRAFADLARAGLIVPSYHIVTEPDNWFWITDAGREAIRRGVFDDLDESLKQIDPHLMELREGAWSTLRARGPEFVRQAAQSGRELIDQILRAAAPEAAVRSMPGFVRGTPPSPEITRRHRILFLLSAKEKSELTESVPDLVLAAHKRLAALSHAEEQHSEQRGEDALSTMEAALRALLVNG